MTTDDEVLNTRNDLEMLKRPHLWPSVIKGHRCVFMKKLDAEHTGPCFKTSGGDYIVIDHDWTNHGEVTPVTYNSAEAVLAAGWVVD